MARTLPSKALDLLLNARILAAISCAIGGLLLAGSELLNTFTVESIDGQAIAVVSAVDRHLFSLGLLGLVGVMAAAVAVVYDSRPAAVVVVVSGLCALALIAAIDLPDLGSADLVLDPNGEYAQGEAVAASGLWVSLAGSVLLMLSGVALALLTGDGPRQEVDGSGQPGDRDRRQASRA